MSCKLCIATSHSDYDFTDNDPVVVHYLAQIASAALQWRHFRGSAGTTIELANLCDALELHRDRKSLNKAVADTIDDMVDKKAM